MVVLSRDTLSNIFYGARPALGEVFSFMHMNRTGVADADVPQSSQALALDVFGTLKHCRSRDRICDQIAILLEVPNGGPWDIHLEYVDPDNILGEKQHQTQLDVVMFGSRSLIAMECKFAEKRLDPCGQTGKTGKGLVQCNGNYETQTNPSNGRAALCALTGKKIRYWEYVPRVFRLSADEARRLCPFAGARYQWMRTLVTAYALAEKRGLTPAVGLVHVDRRSMPLHARIKDEAPRMKELLTGAVKCELMRYEKMAGVFEAAGDPSERGLFQDLHQWVEAKVNWVEARLDNERAGRKTRAR